MKVTIAGEAKPFYTVGQDEAVIASAAQELRTAGIVTCSALLIGDNKTKLMAHIDAQTDTKQLADTIAKYIDLNSSDLMVVIVPGADAKDTNEHSQVKARNALHALGLQDRYMTDDFSYNDFMKDLVFGKSGQYYSDEHKKPDDYTITRDGVRYQFSTNAAAHEVSALSDGSKVPIVDITPNAILGAPKVGQEGDANMVGIYKKLSP